MGDKVHLNLRLREWSPMTNLLNKIPPKAQRGLTSLDLKLTCVAGSGEFLALGTNIGIVYWYNRKGDRLERLRTQNTNCPICSITLVSGEVDFSLAVGNTEGLITIFQIPKDLVKSKNNSAKSESLRQRFINGTLLKEQKKNQLVSVQRFDIAGVHESKITCLEWDQKGTKLFSGDVNGSVVMTELDTETLNVTSGQILQEQSEIVQLSYYEGYLLVCSVMQSVILVLERNQVYKVGTQERKVQEKFGGVFSVDLDDKEPYRLYSARPGGRIWVADTTGLVQHTIKFKDLLLDENQAINIPLINPIKALYNSKPCPQDFQIGLVTKFMSSYLITWHKQVLYFLDPMNTRILGMCSELKGILSVAVNSGSNEIFVLESDRNLIRLSTEPDCYFILPSSLPTDLLRNIPTNIPKFMSNSIADFRLDMEQPISFFTSKIKQTSKFVLDNPKINSVTLLNTLKQVIESDGDVQDGQSVIPLRSSPEERGKEIVENYPDEEEHYDGAYASQNVVAGESQVPDKFQHISRMPFDDVLLVPPKPGATSKKKKNKKKTKKPRAKQSMFHTSSGDTVSMTSSTYSTNSEEDTKFSTPTEEEDNFKLPTTENPLLLPQFPMSLSQSWSASEIRPANEEASIVGPDLRSKEELLAKKLNWPELLPEFCGVMKPTLEIDLEADEDTDSTLYVPVHTITVKESSRFSEPNEQTIVSLDSRSSTRDGSSDVFDDSLDIYTKYASKHDDSAGSSIPSALSFGPPSSVSQGSANLLSTSNNTDGLPQPKIVQVREGSLLTSPEDELPPLDLVPVRDMVVEPVSRVGNEKWVLYAAPAPLQSVSASDHFIVCADKRNNVYVSELSSCAFLRWIQTAYVASQVAVSSCGSVFWRIDKGVLYSLPRPDLKTTIVEGSTWSKLLSDVACATVQMNIGWVVKTDGTIYVCSGLLGTAVVPDFDRVHAPFVALQIVAEDYKVWVVTRDGRLFFRNGVSDDSPHGTEWVEKYFESQLPHLPTSIALGPLGTLWIGDDKCNLHFVEGICAGDPSRDFRAYYEGRPHYWRVSFVTTPGESTAPSSLDLPNGTSAASSEEGISFSLSSFKTKLTKLNPKASTRAPLIAGTYSSLWFAVSGSVDLYLNQKLVDGHRWTLLKVSRPLRANAWVNLMAGSIYEDNGFLWLVDPKGKLFYCYPSGGEGKSIDLPCSKVTCVIPGPEALWLLNQDGTIYARGDICQENPVGHGWSKIDVSIEKSRLVHVSCGSEVAWGVDVSGRVFMRSGSLRPAGWNDISPAWIPVDDNDPSTTLMNGIITKVYVGPNGSMVWALDDKNNIYVREAVFIPDLPIGTNWYLVSGIEAICLSLSETSVWALSPSGEIFRRFGISSTNFIGDYWKKIPIPNDSTRIQVLTASICDQLWALDSSGQIFKHCNRSLNFKERQCPKKPQISLDPEDKDWELVESLELY